ncbi:hypothetical protein HPC49_12220 [Pyxidicoccus fallax]|uniref:Uncharacterized protein n=1 Tax=Pyxidicoccus fallax TaxID=394095 RepID=A0A848LI08_9BACT|nr:hypothetical protein [Pyxidicoccus fallax]NMO16968.1 hypothetical protein [Pyxidicoccus fallax]NPC79001.1 hypothetical protein [Pyxidicoccus fallax]
MAQCSGFLNEKCRLFIFSGRCGSTWSWIDRGIESPVMLGFLSLFLSFRGGGALSVDRAIGSEL